jgi:hypothetical protein
VFTAFSPVMVDILEDMIKQWLPIILFSGNVGSSWRLMIIPFLIYVYKYVADWYREKYSSSLHTIKIVHDFHMSMPYSMKAICWYVRSTVKPEKCVFKIDREYIQYDGDGDIIKNINKIYLLDSCPRKGIDFTFPYPVNNKDETISINLNYRISKDDKGIIISREIILSSIKEEYITYFIDQIIAMYMDYNNKAQLTEKPHVYTCNKPGSVEWVQGILLLSKTFDNLFIDQNIKTQLKNDLDTFLTGREFYTRVGIPYKRSYLFYGPPGTGKSSSYYAIANYTQRDLYKLSLVGLDSEKFRLIISNIPSGVVLAIDDVDRVHGTCKKSDAKSSENDKKNKEKDSEKVSVKDSERGDSKRDLDDLDEDSDVIGSRINISTFLEIFDGYDYLQDTIVILTTNNFDKLDPALIRPGRSDLALNITHPSDQTCTDIFNYFFPNEKKEVINSQNRSTAEIITRIIIPNKNDYNKCLELLDGSRVSNNY